MEHIVLPVRVHFLCKEAGTVLYRFQAEWHDQLKPDGAWFWDRPNGNIRDVEIRHFDLQRRFVVRAKSQLKLLDFRPFDMGGRRTSLVLPASHQSMLDYNQYLQALVAASGCDGFILVHESGQCEYWLKNLETLELSRGPESVTQLNLHEE